jgi:hypothetical protein
MPRQNWLHLFKGYASSPAYVRMVGCGSDGLRVTDKRGIIKKDKRIRAKR